MNKRLLYMLFEIDHAKRIQFKLSTTEYDDSVELRKYGLVVISTTTRHDTVCVTLSDTGNKLLWSLINFAGKEINEYYGL